MFTGIVQEIGIIDLIEQNSTANKIKVKCNAVLRDAKQGDSIAVNGVCLTAKDIGQNYFTADVMLETVRRTSFSFLKKGDKVNLEPAIKLCDRLGGHIVLGHTDGVGEIKKIKPEGNAVWYEISIDKELLRYINFKGSIALDGISLTVAEVGEDYFSVSVIPHTGNMTNIACRKPKDVVNIECDVLAKYVEKFLLKSRVEDGRITEDFLAQYGYK